MAVRSGDAPAHRRHKAHNSPSIPQYHISSSPTSGSKSSGKSKKSVGVVLSAPWRHFRHNLNHAAVSRKVQWQIGVFFVFVLFGWVGWRASFSSLGTRGALASIRDRPRVVALESPLVARELESTKVERWRSQREVPYGEPAMAFDDDKTYDKFEVMSDDAATGCKFIADWQKQSSAKSTCNTLHEIGMKVGQPGLKHRLEFIDSGRLKEVWRVFEEDNTPADFVLKMPVNGRDFNKKELAYHRKDALVTTEATSNPYVLDMYAYCHYSSVAEAAKGTLQSWIKSNRKHLSSLELLEIATMIANGVEGAHLYHNNMPTLAHADIKTPQFLLVERGNSMVFKLNDFNRGRFLTSNYPPKICPFIIAGNHKGSTCRAPEEYEKKAPQTDKIDVFSTGSMFYHVLTGRDPFKDIPFKDAMENIRGGVHPPLPSSIRESTDPSITAIVDAMNQCHRFRAEDRPSSRQIARQLRAALEKIQADQSGPNSVV